MFNSFLGHGSMSGIMSMIPGLQNMPGINKEESNKKMQRFLVILDSMTDSELDGLSETPLVLDEEVILLAEGKIPKSTVQENTELFEKA